MSKLHIPVDDDKCCLCGDDNVETQLHLFSGCNWTNKVKNELETWSGVTSHGKKVAQCLSWIKGRH